MQTLASSDRGPELELAAASPGNDTNSLATLLGPYCAPGTRRTPLAPLVSSHQPASTRRMIARLHEAFTKSSTIGNSFSSDKLAEYYGTRLAQNKDPRQALDLEVLFARQLLNLGQSEAALKMFVKFEQDLRATQSTVSSRSSIQLMLWKALCHLRLGEQENCQLNHNADSCLFPIQGGGVHKLTRGARGAVDVLTQLLEHHPTDLSGRWLLNISYMTLGEYPDKVPAPWLIPPKVFESDYDIKRFPDVAGNLGLDIDDYAGGVVMEDFDGDGFLDLMVSSWDSGGQLRVFRNNGDGTFTERTSEAGLAGLYGGLNLIQGDFNNDGFPDVLVLRGAWLGALGEIPNSLLRNNGDFTFTDVTEEAGLLSYHPTQTAVWFDYNNDGWLDIFIGNESAHTNIHPCELFRNNGDGTFTECAAEEGVAVIGFVKGVVSGDFNNDGRPDLYLSRRGEPNILLRNDGPFGEDHSPKARWRFTDVTSRAGVAEPLQSFPCWFFDYDNDGWLDLFVMGYSIREVGDVAADYLGLPHGAERARLYHNNGDGTFKDVTAATGLYKVLHAMGANFGDLDNDGWLDFYVGTGDPDLLTLIPNRMFRNNGGKYFQDVTTSGGFGQLQKGHGIAFGDIDNDGDQDIYSVVGGAYTGDNYRNQLFANPGHGNHWIKLKLRGVHSNRVAIGARIKVVVRSDEGERAIHRVVGSGGSFGANPLRQEIGLGQAKQIVRAEIFWPVTGRTQVLTGLQMDRLYEVEEGASPAAPTNLATFKLPASPNSPEHHHGHAAATSEPAGQSTGMGRTRRFGTPTAAAAKP